MAGISKWAAFALISASGLALTACASDSGPHPLDPKYSTRLPGPGPHQQATAKPQSPRQQGAGSSQRGGTWKPYQVAGKWYYPEDQPDYDETGTASWYGDAFNGKPTANGETFDMYGLSAAHKTLPLPSIVEVTNLDNGRSMQLRVNDRGPFVDDRLIDLSRGAADKLGVLRPGLARVRVRYIGPAKRDGAPLSRDLQYAAASPPPRQPKPKPIILAPPPPLPQPEPEIQLPQAEPAPQPEVRPDLRPAPRTDSVAAGHYEIQAGAFSTRANAERAASQLAQAGDTEIRETDRNGQTLYRVFVHSLPDQTAAQEALGKVAASGYRDAVVRPLN
jgi:rare lipoprotein A